MLTKKQRDLLLFIHQRLSVDDVPPSFEEMKEALGLKSKSGIHRLISGLEERGYIERMPHRARALEIKKLPDGIKNTGRETHDATNAITQMSTANQEFDQVPLYGKIAAGTPIAAIRNEGEFLQIPSGFAGNGELYALTIEGDSMINAGINDSDIVIIQRCDTAENGAIIVALIDDEEATLKRLRRAGGKIVLEPENDAYEPRILEPERVKVQGRLVSLMRSYH
ncbi:MAG TPA: transcriptional repressor LexA [Alphaproteobacteria bacterium]|nr:transcriptional repressor LexA [Alphaproteobacteria bacterium]USO06150.1 MAG: transcriptional repressor LexA [Rhodospirillales bacterium]HOO82781.1 transcriptional repressor LexA [Alphaproteobacteria bacterium]